MNIKERLLHIEIMRILAIIFVVLNHTGKYGSILFAEYSPDTIQYWIYLAVSIFEKMAVPLFFAISGAIMLNRPNEPMMKLCHRIFRMLSILLLFSFIYYIIDIINGSLLSVGGVLKIIYSDTIRGPLWFLYLYIGYLIILPFLRILVQNMSKLHFMYMFALAVFFNGLPVIEYLSFPDGITINEHLKIAWLSNWAVLYPCLGFYLQHKVKFESIHKILPYIWTINIAAIILSVYMSYKHSMIEGYSSEAFHRNFLIFNCAAIYISVRWLFERRSFNLPCTWLIRSVGRCTFGIYLLHQFFMGKFFFMPIMKKFQGSALNDMICVFIATFFIVLLSYITTFILSKTPIIKKIIGF